MKPDGALDPRKLYRLPWNSADNIIAWLEPTRNCNIYCEGCYSANVPGSHKTLDRVRQDLDVFDRLRRTDAVSIAGGDPLTHPEIAKVVAMVAERGRKPIVNTNGVALTPALLRSLKDAGLHGFTFHVDSLQKRPGWAGRSELELNELRLHYARMAASVGGLSCAFNATVYETTLPLVPDLLKWAHEHADIVHIMVFIAFRAAVEDGRFDYYVGDRRLDVRPQVYTKAAPQRSDIGAREIASVIRRRFPDFEPCAYLGGTEDPASLKWLLTLTLCDRDGLVGCAGGKFVELGQMLNHLVHNRYLGYLSPRTHGRGRWMLPLGLLDPGLRKTWLRDLAAVARDPLRLFRPLHLQSVMIIQPVDVGADGSASMCDGCPDMTVHGDRLVWSCRLEEQLRYGQFMRMVPGARSLGEAPRPPAREPATEEQPVG